MRPLHRLAGTGSCDDRVQCDEVAALARQVPRETALYGLPFGEATVGVAQGPGHVQHSRLARDHPALHARQLADDRIQGRPLTLVGATADPCRRRRHACRSARQGRKTVDVVSQDHPEPNLPGVEARLGPGPPGPRHAMRRGRCWSSTRRRGVGYWPEGSGGRLRRPVDGRRRPSDRIGRRVLIPRRQLESDRERVAEDRECTATSRRSRLR